MSNQIKYYGPGIPASVALKEFNRIQEYIRTMKLKK